MKSGELDIIECDVHKTVPRCREMLNIWLEKDLDASWEKLQKAVKEALPSSKRSQHVHSKVKLYLQGDYKNIFFHKSQYSYSHQLKEFINIAFIHHSSNEITYPEIEAVANTLYNGEIIFKQQAN